MTRPRNQNDDSTAKPTAGEELVGQVRGGIIQAAAAGIAGGLIAASLAAWGVVKSWPSLLGLVPTGAVMAFSSECSSNRGWKDFRHGTGRMIIGAGQAYVSNQKENLQFWYQTQPDGTPPKPLNLRSYTVLETGGEEAHILSVREIPSHNHSISTRRDSDMHDGLGGSQASYGIDQVYDKNSPQVLGFGPLHQVISSTGENGAHNNMPPFIAMFWCEKE